jgi:hypothetical protein
MLSLFIVPTLLSSVQEEEISSLNKCQGFAAPNLEKKAIMHKFKDVVKTEVKKLSNDEKQIGLPQNYDEFVHGVKWHHHLFSPRRAVSARGIICSPISSGLIFF